MPKVVRKIGETMRAIETKAVVSPDGTLTARVPADIQSGEHQVVPVIEEKRLNEKKRPLKKFPVILVGEWPADLSLRREGLYDESES